MLCNTKKTLCNFRRIWSICNTKYLLKRFKSVECGPLVHPPWLWSPQAAGWSEGEFTMRTQRNVCMFDARTTFNCGCFDPYIVVAAKTSLSEPCTVVPRRLCWGSKGCHDQARSRSRGAGLWLRHHSISIPWILIVSLLLLLLLSRAAGGRMVVKSSRSTPLMNSASLSHHGRSREVSSSTVRL